MIKEDDKKRIAQYIAAVQNGFGSITDSSVKKEWERVYGIPIEIPVHAEILSVLEALDLLDKKNSINKDPFFYRKMRVEV